jgi:hypothetical protein
MPQSIGHQFGVANQQLVRTSMDHHRWHVVKVYCDRGG